MQPVKRTIQSVDRVVAILDQLAAAPAGLTLKALADHLRLAPQTLQGLLRTLQAHRLVTQDGHGQPYTLGPHVHALSRAWVDHCDLPALARDALGELSDVVNENILLAEMRGGVVLGLAETRSQRTLMVRPELNSREYLHTMATARVLLAFLPPDQQGAILATMRFTKLGPNTITTAARFRKELAAVRAHGHAVCLEECGQGVAALAVPVRSHAGEVAAALGVSLPLVRLDRWTVPDLLSRLTATARQIESAWGFDGQENK